jgi:hypothetical protein
MIKVAGQLGDRPFMLLGLSGENVTRLAAGEPIAFDADQLGYAGKVIVMYGRTEADIKAQLREHGLVPPDGSVD